MKAGPLKRIRLEDLAEARSRGRDTEAEEGAARIIADVAARGEAAVREWSEKLGELGPGDPLVGRPAEGGSRDRPDRSSVILWGMTTSRSRCKCSSKSNR